MKTRRLLLLVTILATLVIEWRLATSMGAARTAHFYHGLCNAGVGDPYCALIHELRLLSEKGDTNGVVTILRRADQKSYDLYVVWLDGKQDSYRQSVIKMLKAAGVTYE